MFKIFNDSNASFEMYTSSDRYKNDLNDAPTTQSVVGSTLPLVVNTRKKGGLDDNENGYNPFDHRHVEHPTS